ncbi:DUF1320 domain-containing protein [Budviciaceae bacterium CWB-B4]|uniref:DUF1320 domain-containing protein n=1 Tax=Limnobaculum xujianqingii TaxID=2738837 RepID=A0A9D7FX47_9GAMM|nr:DUF1320 domain-containing protein [Limnobaculum xujianqingii]MBK5072572.1 DUF1320 domain-containing protein [Limnobaculum xujianqingii]MBK5175881.1 DUF1320 domain-containing protein [Limnobaculum xujianqingii]
MGQYCTQQDLVEAFGELEIIQISDRARPPTKQIDSAVVDKAITDAESEINMYLEGRGLLPLKSVPVTLRRIACDMSRFYLYQNPKSDSPVAVIYARRVKQLEGVASGKLSLGLDKAGEVMEPEDTVMFHGGRNMFKREDGLW